MTADNKKFDDRKFIEGPELPRTEVKIIDRGEGYSPYEAGTIPNHDKIEIEYVSDKLGQ